MDALWLWTLASSLEMGLVMDISYSVSTSKEPDLNGRLMLSYSAGLPTSISIWVTYGSKPPMCQVQS